MGHDARHRTPHIPPSLILTLISISLVYLLFMDRLTLPLQLLLKPLPVLLMALWAWRQGPGRFPRAIAVGLLLSMLGDIALVFEGVGPFVLGLVFFLTAHVFYVLAFVSDTRAALPLRALPSLVGVGGLFVFLLPGLGDMVLPVAAYCLVIGSMVWRALARLGAVGVERTSQLAGAIGAVSFALSDSLLALDKFHAPIQHVGYAIMLTYWFGQAAIAGSAGRGA